MAADRTAGTVSTDTAAMPLSNGPETARRTGRPADPTRSIDTPAIRADDAEAHTGHADCAGEAPGWFGRGRSIAVILLAAVLVGATVASVFLGRRVAEAGDEERLRTEAVQTARQLVVNFTTLDHRSLRASTSGVLALTAGDFRQEYTVASRELEKVVAENKTVSRGKVLDAGIVSFDNDSARVLVVADSRVTNVATDKPQLRTYRLQLDLSREPSGWRVVELQFVG
jgi:Mce-associated membrane protein